MIRREERLSLTHEYTTYFINIFTVFFFKVHSAEPTGLPPDSGAMAPISLGGFALLSQLLLELSLLLTEFFPLRRWEPRDAYSNKGSEPPCRTALRRGDGTSSRTRQPPATLLLRHCAQLSFCVCGLELLPLPSFPLFFFPSLSPTSKIFRQINRGSL